MAPVVYFVPDMGTESGKVGLYTSSYRGGMLSLLPKWAQASLVPIVDDGAPPPSDDELEHQRLDERLALGEESTPLRTR